VVRDEACATEPGMTHAAYGPEGSMPLRINMSHARVSSQGRIGDRQPRRWPSSYLVSRRAELLLRAAHSRSLDRRTTRLLADHLLRGKLANLALPRSSNEAPQPENQCRSDCGADVDSNAAAGKLAQCGEVESEECSGDPNE
jgi:hypothetical protein